MNPTSTLPRLTARQADALESIRAFYDRTGASPTTRQLAEAIGVRSVSTAHAFVVGLVKKGYLRKVDRGPATTYVPVKR